MQPPHPLAKDHLVMREGLPGVVEANQAGEEELERRDQELWNAFLKFYFSGDPFSLPEADGSASSRSFVRCDLLFEEDVAPANVPRPIIHMTTVDRREVRKTRVPGAWSIHCRWTKNFLVRVPSQAEPAVTGDDVVRPAVNAKRLARKVGDQLRWLLESEAVQSLSLKGVMRVSVANGPRPMGAGAWHMRQLVVTHESYHEVPRTA